MFAETVRLVIRDLIPEDCSQIHSVFGDKLTNNYTNFFKASEEETRAWLEETIKHNEANPRFAHSSAIVLRATGEVIGWIGFGHSSRKEIGDRDFGYALRRGLWNHGYMTEALTAVLRFCFVELEVNSVFGECQPENPASARVMEKAGMTYVGTFPAHSEEGILHQRFIAFRREWLDRR
jgi:RimJ/RimL family protein N-acetyltransferase